MSNDRAARARAMGILESAPWRNARPPTMASPRAAELRAGDWRARTSWPGFSREEAFARARILTDCAKRWEGRSAASLKDAVAAGEKPCARALAYLDREDAASLVSAHPTAFCDELDFIAPVVAHAGGAALDYWFWHAFAPTRRDRAFKLLPHLASPRMVPIVLDGYWRLDSLRARARAWLRSFPDEALRALVPLALGASFEALGLTTVKPPKSEAPLRPAMDAIRWLGSIGERARCIAVATELGFEDEVRALLDVHPLAGSNAPARTPEREALPTVTIDGQPLTAELRARFLDLLAVTSWEAPVPELRALTCALDAPSRSAFFGALLDDLAKARRLHDLRCAFHMAADLPEIRARLLDLLRAQMNADEIKALGTTAVVEQGTAQGEAALSLLGELALSGASRSQEKLTNEVLERVAEALELPRDTLDDRLVPRLGLDTDGAIAIGGLVARLDASLRPFLVAPDGSRLADLPARAKKDRATADAWKSLRAGARKVASGLERRAQAWMLARQRWHLADFRENVLAHPVLRELSRGFVWGLFDTAIGALARTFRIAEDASLASIDDDAVTLPDDALVGMVHPIELSADDLASWRRILTEYEVLPIFTQLGWPTHRLTDEERAATTLTRLHGRRIESERLPADFGWGGIYKDVWFNGPRAARALQGAHDAQITYERRLSNGLRAMVFFEPTGFSWKTRTVREVAVQRLTDLDWSVRRPWSEVDPVDASETLRELEQWLST
ncbi:MAG: DUF4132 domain-containing protein [Polyangiaceae bacterium]